jgi:hypothetical protein
MAQHDGIDVGGVLCSTEGLPQIRDQYGQLLSSDNEPQWAPDIQQGAALDDFAGGGEEVAAQQRTWRPVLGGVESPSTCLRKLRLPIARWTSANCSMRIFCVSCVYFYLRRKYAHRLYA